MKDKDGDATKGRTFLELAHFRLWHPKSDLPQPGDPTPVNNWFEDPWGNPYWYCYKKNLSDATWVSPSFVLYSHGPDGKCVPGEEENSGLLSEVPDDPENADNIYFGRD